MPENDPLAPYVAHHAERALRGLRAVPEDLSVELVHDTRTSLRRLRATLRSVPDSFTAPAGIEKDLRRVALAFGDVRDADVLAEQLHPALDALPGHLEVESARGVIAAALTEARERATADLATCEHTTWWQRAAEQLESWSVSSPGLADTELTAVLERGRERVRTRLVRADGEPEKLHSARKAAKRWRYAAELLERDEPSAAAHLRESEHVQKVLGQLQDAVLIEEFLGTVGTGDRLEDRVRPVIDHLRTENRRRLEERVREATTLL